jgi:hypothetical protein
MKTGIHFEAPRVDAEAGAAVAGAICELLEVAARTRTSDTVTLAALDALRLLTPKGLEHISLNNCSVQGDTHEGDRIIP